MKKLPKLRKIIWAIDKIWEIKYKNSSKSIRKIERVCLRKKQNYKKTNKNLTMKKENNFDKQ